MFILLLNKNWKKMNIRLKIGLHLRNHKYTLKRLMIHKRAKKSMK